MEDFWRVFIIKMANPLIMNRDGNTKSIWQENLPNYQCQNHWHRETVYDVLIVGGGITGLTTAVLLQEQEKKCILVEAHNIAYGTSSGTTAHLNTLIEAPYYDIIKDFGEDDARLVSEGCKEAISLIETLSQRYGINSDFSRQPGYLVAGNDDEVKELEKVVEGARKAGLDVQWTDSAPVPVPFMKGAIFPDEAQIDPTKYIYGLAKAFEQLGGVILQDCLVSNAVFEGDSCEAETSQGKVLANRLVYATHIPPGVNILHFRCAPYRSYAASFTLKSGEYPKGLVYDMKDPYHYFRTHQQDGKTHIIAGGYDHKTGHEDNTEERFLMLHAYIKGLYDVDTIVDSWSSQFYVSADGLPYIGLLSGHDDTYCATGFSGNGITFGALSGRVLSDILLGKQSPYEELFRPNRVKPVAGFAAFVKENADVVSQFIGGRFAFEKVSALVELAPGEGKLAIWEGKKVGLCKDENGKVFAVDPVCPHAGCLVGWNTAELSWDCPCHGARYAPDGELLNGPATHALQALSWEEVKE